MRRKRLIGSTLALLAVVAIAVVVIRRERPATATHPRTTRSHGSTPAVAAVPAIPSAGSAAQAAQESLLASSETFRNTTLLVAIRDAGFLCAEVLSAQQVGDQGSGWRVGCPAALAYSVIVAESGRLTVKPVAQWDGVAR